MKYIFTLLFFCLSTLWADEPLPWLRAQKTAIVDEKGSTVTLRGVNLGGWLQEEMWMLPFVREAPSNSDHTEILDHVSLWRTFEKRFGKEKMHEIRKSYRNTWLTHIDFANIKAAGFNVVRLPFLYDLQNHPEGLFYWLDRAVELAQKNGLYVILDLHGAPGRQGSHEHTGESNKDEFFKNHAHVNKTCEIWKEIAHHYKDCSTIAGYDLLNEPTGAPSSKELYKITDRLYKAVRSEDKKHLIFIEDGYKGISKMPHPKEFKWENIVMSTHFYVFEENTTDEFLKKFHEHLKGVEDKQNKSQVPYYLGEFNVAPRGSLETMKRVLSVLHEKKISYSFWTYKIGRRGHKNSLWGIYYAPGNQKNIDPFRDSHKDILKKIERLHSKNYEKNRDLIHHFKN